MILCASHFLFGFAICLSQMKWNFGAQQTVEPINMANTVPNSWSRKPRWKCIAIYKVYNESERESETMHMSHYGMYALSCGNV